ncbi:unnamed protein product [Mucor hiemalis]
MFIIYFFRFRTSAREWCIAEAIIVYDKKDSALEMSLNLLPLEIKSVLKTIVKTQTSLNRYVLKALTQVDKLLQLRCLGVTGRGPQELENREHPAVNVNKISQDEQVNIAGVNNITMNQPRTKRRALYEITNQAATDVGEGSSPRQPEISTNKRLAEETHQFTLCAS